MFSDEFALGCAFWPHTANSEVLNMNTSERMSLDRNARRPLIVITYPPVVQTWEGSDSTCGSLCHNHHRTTAGPGTEENIHIDRCYYVGTDLKIKAEDTRALTAHE